MLINLKTYAATNEQHNLTLELRERLPNFLSSPCVIHCLFNLKAFKNYYLLSLKTEAMLKGTCQRCLGEFLQPYTNQSLLAICDSEGIAEKMLGQYDCVVSDNQVDLQELLTDELHLYAPQFHLDDKDCDQGINQFIHH